MPHRIQDRPGDDPTRSFRRAWEAPLDCGVARPKDIAFARAIEGELIRVFSRGKLTGAGGKSRPA